MSTTKLETAGPPDRRSDEQILVDRVRKGLWLGIVVVILLTVADPLVHGEQLGPLWTVKLAYLFVIGGSLALFERFRSAWGATAIGTTNVVAVLFLTAIGGAFIADDGTTVLLATVVTLFSATMLPWGAGPHSLIVVAGVLATLLNVYLVHGRIPAIHTYRLLALGAVWIWSIHLSGELVRRRSLLGRYEEERRRAQEALREEARVSSGLARVGQDLIEHLDEASLLERLCRRTVEVLGCDFSHTWIRDPESDAIRPVAAAGDPVPIAASPPEGVSAARSVVERDVADLLSRETVTSALDRTTSELRTVVDGDNRLLCVSLHSGDAVVGVHVAGYRDRDAPAGDLPERILRGVAQLASFALKYTRTLHQLEDANRLKSQFVANMSHELRTPINVIRGYTDLVLSGEYGKLDEEVVETLQRMDGRAADLQELIDATLALGQLDMGEMVVERRDVAVEDLVARVESETCTFRDGSSLRFEWQIEDALERIHIDLAKVVHVLRKLVANAFKFTEEGYVRVGVRRDGDGLVLTVDDTGVGIPETLQSAIFEPFRQGDGSSTRHHGGTGVGLHLCRRLVELMGGRIGVESEVGGGSRFRVWLPEMGEAGGSQKAEVRSQKEGTPPRALP